jgi:HPt (histidine-containing phosphotransfer) domain-containing protein
MIHRDSSADSFSRSYRPPGEPIDIEALARLRTDVAAEPSMFNEIIAQFIGELTPRLNAIGDAIGGADEKATAAAAHRLKGGSMLVGARGMAELCLQIEMAARAGTMEHARALLNLLREEAVRVRQALAAAQSA